MPRIVVVFLIIVILSGLQVFGQTPIPPLPQPITLGDQVTGELASGETRTWFFEGQANQTIVLSADRFPPNPESLLDPMLELYDSAGNLVATDDNSGAMRDALLVNLVLPATDTYQIHLTNMTEWNGEGGFRLDLAENPFSADCQTPMGDMIQAELPSEINRFPMRYQVFMPPCHESAGVRYPYVILLHGSNTDHTHWSILGADKALLRGIALGELPPMALVMPFGGDLANTNTFREGGSWEWVIVDELLPHLETSYCLSTERDQRAIGGISRGGFWAFVLAFRHPDLFAVLGGHSPFFDLYHAPETHNPLDLSMGTAPTPPLRIWMDRGANDYAQANIDLQHERLTDNTIEHLYNLYPVGQHENAYWGAYVDEYLAFYSAEWTDEQSLLAPCNLNN